MKDGMRVIDVDTHVNPTVEVLMRYADKELLERADELKGYTRTIKPATKPDGSDSESLFAIKQIRYTRIAGHKEGERPDVGKEGFALVGRTNQRATRPFSPRIADDNPTGRLADMDVEGVDIDFIIPGTWSYGTSALQPEPAEGLYRAYHRYMADYCSADPRRLKGLLLVAGADPEWAAKTIHERANEDWLAAVWPVLPQNLPIDDPDLEPIWKAANEHDLPIMYHAFMVEPPYFPGYLDIWGNQAVARCAGQTWGAQRSLTYMLVSGVFDRYPNLRYGCLETGHGWLPHWLLRLTRHLEYVRDAFPPDLKHTPMEYAAMGKIFCGVEYHEGAEMTKAVIDILGDHILMYQSDFPHPECLFPRTTDTVLAWKDTVGEQAMEKLMWENATRFLRLASAPWPSRSEQRREGEAVAGA